MSEPSTIDPVVLNSMIAASVASALAVTEERRQYREAELLKNNFDMILLRFDAVDKDNADIKHSLSKHIEEDLKVHAVVSRQSTYWGLLIGLGAPLILGIVAWFRGLFG